MKSILAASAILAALLPWIAAAEAVLYVSPERGTYSVGETFDMKVYADTGGVPVNAAEAELSFQNETLEVLKLSTDGSILESWSAGPEFSNIDGTIHFAGWTKKNYNGVSGLLLTVTFKATKNAVGTARLAAGAILAADGRESNIITSMRSGIFTINAPEIPEDTDDSPAAATSSPNAARVPAPVFDEYPDVVEVGDHIVIRGNAEPNSRVYVWVSHGSESETRTDILAAADGSFTFVSGEKTKPGVYHIRATSETSDGRLGFESESIEVTAAERGAAASALSGASLLFEVFPFLSVVVIGGLGAAYLYHRHQLAKMHYGRHAMYDEIE